MDKKNKCKIYCLIICVLLLVVITLQLISFEPKYREVEIAKIIKTNYVYNEINKVDVLHSDCVNAEIEYPNHKSNKIWISELNYGEKGFCYIRYRTKKLCIFC